MIITFKWSNKFGGKFKHTYNFSLRKNDFENTRRIWSLALDDCGWENRETLVDVSERKVVTWKDYINKYET